MDKSRHDLRVIALDGGLNFRDMGGYETGGGRRVRFRRLFRSGTTDALSPTDRTKLAKLGIRTVVDLRSNQERSELPHGLKDDARVVYHSYEHAREGGNLLRMLDRPDLEQTHLQSAMMHLYRELPYEFGDIYRQLFRKIADGALPLVFNCAAGKDRTGVAAALLLCAIGVSWEDVMTDYLLTAQFVPDIVRKFGRSTLRGRLDRFAPAVVAPMFEARATYLEAMREAVVARSGSIDEYLHVDLGLGPGVLRDLREQLVS
jgi:protein-tyrosine phosphatase